MANQRRKPKQGKQLKKLESALATVLDLARQNMIDDPDYEAEAEEQQSAIDLVASFANGVWMICEREPSGDFDNTGLPIVDIGIDDGVANKTMPVVYFMVDGYER